MKEAKFLKRFLFYSFVLILFTACSARKARQQKTLFNHPSDIVTDTIKQVYVVNDKGISTNYKIRVNDWLAIRNVQDINFGGKSATTTAITTTVSGGTQNVLSYEVEQDGKVNLPAIGKVDVIGLTRREASNKIEQIYQDKQLPNPIIELSIVNLKVTLLGEFSKQGNFLLQRDNTTLIDILGEAGGITKTADPKTLKIFRGDRTDPEIIHINLNDYKSLASQKLILQNNDIIVIQPDKNVAVAEKLQGFNNIIQPLLVVVNLAVLIFTLTR